MSPQQMIQPQLLLDPNGGQATTLAIHSGDGLIPIQLANANQGGQILMLVPSTHPQVLGQAISTIDTSGQQIISTNIDEQGQHVLQTQASLGDSQVQVIQQQQAQQAAVSAPQVVQVNGQQQMTVSQPASNSPHSTSQAKSQSCREEEPLYVNAKQYHRIIKRREARAKLEAQGRIPKERQKYLHESRHKHAMNRIRSSGGRFFSVPVSSSLRPRSFLSPRVSSRNSEPKAARSGRVSRVHNDVSAFQEAVR